jgi:DNA mismatch repair protein MSH6
MRHPCVNLRGSLK